MCVHLRSIWFCFEQSRNPIFREAQCHQSRHSRNASMTVSQELAGSSPNHFICVFSLHVFFLLDIWAIRDFSPVGNVFFTCFYLEIQGFFQRKPAPNTMVNCPSSKAAQLLKAARKVVAKPEARWINKDGWGVTFWDPKKGVRCKKKLKPSDFQVVVLLGFFDDQFLVRQYVSK